jgi:apolipoprotein N-acyltransferase
MNIGLKNYFYTNMHLSRFTSLYLAIAGAILLWLAWPVSPLTLLIFFAWTPILWIEDHVSNWKKLFGLCYLHMVIWNVAVTWWVANASLPGALGAFFANSLIMCLPWILMYFTKRRFGRWVGYGSLIVFWLAFEYIHHNWELSWPWLTLGNAFSTHPEWVQWYEYSGTTGGSIWVLLSNILIYSIFVEFRNRGRSKKYFRGIITWSLLVVIPIIVSRLILDREKKIVMASLPQAVNNIVIVQPNIDPYKEKFSGEIDVQLQKLIGLSEKQIDSNTTLVIWPETAIPAQVWEDEIKENFFYRPVWAFLAKHPRISLLTGIDSYKKYPSEDSASATSRVFIGEDSTGKADTSYYDAYNTAAFLDADTNISLYHKAKLVPGVESLPSFLNFMSKWFESFGGISGTLGRDGEPKVFAWANDTFRAAPIICYESVYGEYVTGYVRRGANILTVITNDGWWGNTAGYKQHKSYARLRAIETRKWVARSANTGISCFIDPLGNVIDPQPWDRAASIKLSIPVNGRMTFYVKHGDMISPAMVVVSILIIVLNMVLWIKVRLDKSLKDKR